jgi:uncharacterized protein (DUF58 family)
MDSGSALLDPPFVAKLEALRRRLEVRARSGAMGELSARGRGGASEFREHRAYAPGDDLRRLDWLAFARSGEPVVKLFRSEEDAVVRLLVDASASLEFGTPSKFALAQRMAAAIGYVALASGQRVQLLIAREGRLRPSGPARRGRRSLPALLAELARVQPAGPIELGRAIDETVALAARAGMLIVLSDFVDPSNYLLALSRARGAGHDVALVQILAPEELQPEWEGDQALVDAESGDVVEMTFDASTVRAYLERLGALCDALASWARKHGASLVICPSDEPTEDAVLRFLERGNQGARGTT